jgi:hypothetical protein
MGERCSTYGKEVLDGVGVIGSFKESQYTSIQIGMQTSVCVSIN